MALRRNGEWALHKVESGKYIVRESGTQRATIITNEFNRGMGLNVGMNTYEVADFSGVEAKFNELANRNGGLF